MEIANKRELFKHTRNEQIKKDKRHKQRKRNVVHERRRIATAIQWHTIVLGRKSTDTCVVLNCTGVDAIACIGQVIHHTVPVFTGCTPKEHHHGRTKISKIRLLVESISQFNFCKQLHTHDGVNEIQQKQHRANVPQSRQRQHQRVDEFTKFGSSSDQSNQTSNAKSTHGTGNRTNGHIEGGSNDVPQDGQPDNTEIK